MPAVEASSSDGYEDGSSMGVGNGKAGIVRWCALAAGLSGLLTDHALASFHFIQIEQVIGGVNGDTTAQAIQLRMRFPGENLFQFARLRAWDAAGMNPITLIDFTASVPNAALGQRVLVASANFTTYTDRAITPDFILERLIPEPYLAAGRLTYEGDDGTIYWSLSFGGSAYVGPTGGSLVNDLDGEFGPAFDGPIPSNGLSGLRFQRTALDASTTNRDDYALTAGPAVFTNNADDSATIVACPHTIDPTIGTDLRDFALFQSCLTVPPGSVTPCCEPADLNGDLTVDSIDYALLFGAFVGP